MDRKLYKIEITLLTPEGEVIGVMLTSDPRQKRLVSLFNKLVREIIDKSDQAWEEYKCEHGPSMYMSIGNDTEQCTRCGNVRELR